MNDFRPTKMPSGASDKLISSCTLARIFTAKNTK